VQIPFFPLVKKDLTFIHFGNDSRVDGLVNFEKLRMIAKEIHQVTAMSRSDSTARSSNTVSSVFKLGKNAHSNNTSTVDTKSMVLPPQIIYPVYLITVE